MRRVSKDERARIGLTLNGRTVAGDAEPRMLLTDFLRHVIGATGTHVGCEHGVCGSIAHADPSSEIPLSLATLGGEVVLRSRRGTRTLAAADFQCGMLQTAREPDELITAVRFPVHRGARVAFREVARRHGDFAMIAVAAWAQAGAGGGTIRVGIGGVADRPAVRTLRLDGGDTVKSAFETLAWELEGYDDIHATARLRRDLLRRVGPAVVEEALQCAA